MIGELLYFLGYLVAGFSLKVGDDFLDELGQGNLAWLPLGIAGICFGLLMAVSEWDLVLFTAIIIGVVFSGKVNHIQYSVGFITIAGILLWSGVPLITDFFGWLSVLILLFMAAVIDEKGNDWTDRNRNPSAYAFFSYRFSLKIVALLLMIPWPGFFFTGIGLWCFDGGYELAGVGIRKVFIQNA